MTMVVPTLHSTSAFASTSISQAFVEKRVPIGPEEQNWSGTVARGASWIFKKVLLPAAGVCGAILPVAFDEVVEDVVGPVGKAALCAAGLGVTSGWLHSMLINTEEVKNWSPVKTGVAVAAGSFVGIYGYGCFFSKMTQKAEESGWFDNLRNKIFSRVL